MNFLAHFELCKGNTNPEFCLGSILPDLSKRAGFQLNRKLVSNLEPAKFRHWKEGILLHWSVDSQFHNSLLFETGLQLWKDALEPEPLGRWKRHFFLHHLLCEMWVDRLILQQNRDASHQMYTVLQQVNTRELNDLSALMFNDITAKLSNIYNQFMEKQFITSYLDQQSFSKIAAGVFCHVTGQDYAPEIPEAILNGLNRLDKQSELMLGEWHYFYSNFGKPDSTPFR